MEVMLLMMDPEHMFKHIVSFVISYDAMLIVDWLLFSQNLQNLMVDMLLLKPKVGCWLSYYKKIESSYEM